MQLSHAQVELVTVQLGSFKNRTLKLKNATFLYALVTCTGGACHHTVGLWAVAAGQLQEPDTEAEKCERHMWGVLGTGGDGVQGWGPSSLSGEC